MKARILTRLLHLARVLLAGVAVSAAAAQPPAAPTLALRIEGLDKAATRNLRLHLGELDPALAAQPARLERIVHRALPEALQPYGWYEATFTLESPDGKPLLRVDPGPRTLWAPADVRVGQAAEVPEVAALLRKDPFPPGKPMSHAAYDRLRDELLRAARRGGFFDARYARSELRVDPTRREARAVLELEPGTRFRFGAIRISGSELDPALLATLAPFRAGDPFDAAAMARFERRLRDTGYFDEIAVRMQREEPDRAAIEVLATDVATSRYDVGAGFSTDSNLRLRFGRQSPLLNRRGHSLSVDAELSEPRQTVEGTWTIPHTSPLDDVVELTAGLKGKNIEDTESLTATTGVAHAMKLFGDWSYRYGASVELERYTLGSETQKDVAYLMPATSISRTKLAPGMDPDRGYSTWTAIDLSDRVVGAPADFLRWRGSAGLLYPLPDDNTRVLARVELGAIWTDAFNQIPASLRFYAGGDRSIRGYDYESLGPRDANGKLIGGRYLAVGSLEVSRRVRPDWRVAAFVDGGGAFTERNDDLYQSVGLGLRWLSPIGQVRVDVAVPVADRENSGFKLHVSMGPPL